MLEHLDCADKLEASVCERQLVGRAGLEGKVGGAPALPFVLQVRVVPWPTLELPRGLEYLERYPYGCAEQTISTAFPLIALGDIGNSTFARHLKLGLIPPPDKKVGPLNMWFESTIAATVAGLPCGRTLKGATSDEQAAA